ncbi:uncharacterized protein LOC130801793 isoform X2 [Amaranthus tricolor]|uniref:uncharacterized protein LOC130801793 isoform X2 n=1 Tax=Amaranthus tricolor TaxID=29722 RepID=UPI00258702B7|nr:uncharacterized protein LOC130801793 isoform X2 [Amaranthus tricolor]
MVTNIGCDTTTKIIDDAMKDQAGDQGPDPERLVKISDRLGLKSNQEILIEAVALQKLKENAEQAEKSVEALERQGTKSKCHVKGLSLEAEITKLEDLISGKGEKYLKDYLDSSLFESTENLKLLKKELSSKLREFVSLKRVLDELPIEAELLQYERRFSELNVHMQDKLHQTRKYYETYNALLEIKDLMLKETSLLNSVDSQKLEKVQVGLQLGQKTFDTLGERYSAAIMNQRHCAVLLNDFQEEYRKNERLKKELARLEKQRSQASS